MPIPEENSTAEPVLNGLCSEPSSENFLYKITGHMPLISLMDNTHNLHLNKTTGKLFKPLLKQQFC